MQVLLTSLRPMGTRIKAWHLLPMEDIERISPASPGETVLEVEPSGGRRSLSMRAPILVNDATTKVM